MSEPIEKTMWGKWVCESAIVNGASLTDEVVQELVLNLTEDRFKTQSGDEVLFDSTYRVDTAKNPAHINMLGNEGELSGKDALGYIPIKCRSIKAVLPNAKW